MPHGPHRLADIASQAGLSQATVDRVLHGRPGASTRATRAVEQAIADLDRQQTQLRLGARSLLVDVVMQAPGRFSAAVRDAVESELGRLRAVSVRARFDLTETGSPGELARRLDRLGTRGRCDGLILKAPDDPLVAAAVDRCAERGIPTVTLVTDVSDCRRVAYVGLDNRSAGATAAYLIDLVTGDRPGAVLATLSQRSFMGERERLEGFVERCARQVLVGGDVDGLDDSMERAVAEVLAERADIVAVYSIGGGNRGIRAALAARSVAPRAYVAHDLDADNVGLLRAGELTAVLHHDLRQDARRALEQLLRARGLLPGAPTSAPASVDVITPHNIPPRLR